MTRRLAQLTLCLAALTAVWLLPAPVEAACQNPSWSDCNWDCFYANQACRSDCAAYCNANPQDPICEDHGQVTTVCAQNCEQNEYHCFINCNASWCDF